VKTRSLYWISSARQVGVYIAFTINYTKKEYRLLVDMVEVAEWVLNAERSNPSDEIKKYSEIYQKILSYAKDMGFENLITYDENSGGYYATFEYEESEHMRYIEQLRTLVSLIFVIIMW